MKVNVHCRTVTIPAKINDKSRDELISQLFNTWLNSPSTIIKIGNVIVRVEELVGVEVI